MKSRALMELADMMMKQYERITGSYNQYELQNMRDAAKAGLEEFDAVCNQIFGANFEKSLCGSVKAAYDELIWNYENYGDPEWKTENEIISQLEDCDELKNAVIIAVRLLKQHNSVYHSEAAKIVKKVRSVVVRYRAKLDPTGTLSPEIPDPVATPNLRNYILEEEIYNLRIQELRTFSEIGYRFGISSAAVSRLFRRAYRDRHGFSAPIPRLVRKYGIRSLETE